MFLLKISRSWRLGKCASLEFQSSSRCVGSSAATFQSNDVTYTTIIEDDEPWKNPEKHALPKQTTTYTDFKEANVDWSYVDRLMPLKTIPEPPTSGGITPSGWRPPQDPPPNLPYYIQRTPKHLPALYLERRRDELNPKTMDFEYVELVTLRNIYGDIFACERDLRNFLEAELRHPVATHVDELKGLIKVKGADRTLLERFVFESGF